MRRSLFAFVSCIVVGTAIVGVFFLLGNTRRLTWEDYDGLKAGEGTMSETDVVSALGRPPDGDIEVARPWDDEVNWLKRRSADADYGKIWKQEGFTIEVLFDSQHKVVDVNFSGSATAEPLLSRIRRWLRR
jgi:hypothetical protein